MSSPAPDAPRPTAVHQARTDNDVNASTPHAQRRQTHGHRSDSDGDGPLCGGDERPSERKDTDQMLSLASEWDEVRTEVGKTNTMDFCHKRQLCLI